MGKRKLEIIGLALFLAMALLLILTLKAIGQFDYKLKNKTELYGCK